MEENKRNGKLKLKVKATMLPKTLWRVEKVKRKEREKIDYFYFALF
jgi:hypothetical protein